MEDTLEWEEDDLLTIVKNKVSESLNLEFKESSALKNTDHHKKEISKDVSSFANSEGGTIIYGIKEENHSAASIDEGSEAEKQYWVDQIINSTIKPRISGLKVRGIELKKQSPNRFAIFISIPQSNTAHQALPDHRYFKRTNLETIMMEDYEIRDVMRRQSAPKLRIRFLLDKNKVEFPDEESLSEELNIIPLISNESPKPAEYVVIRLYIDKNIKIIASAGCKLAESTVSIVVNGTIVELSMITKNWGIPANLPIFEGTPFRISDEPLKIKIPKVQGNHLFYFGYEVASPNMVKNSEFTSLSENTFGYVEFTGNYSKPENN